MKKLFYILFSFLPIIVCAQQNWYKSSPLDYIWKNVGNSCFSAGKAENTRLAFSLSGQPYVAFNDAGYSYKARVMKFDGSNWVDEGNAGFSVGAANYTSLAFNPSGEPYVAFEDCGNGFGITVMKFDSVLGINEQNESGLLMYPNPATNKITVETFAIPTKSQLSIMNLSGQQLITRQIIEPKTQIDISTLPEGVYFFRLTSLG